MRKRNTILALVAAGLLTVVAFAPALAVGLDCSNYPSPNRCPISAIYENLTPHAIVLSSATQTHQAYSELSHPLF